MVECLIAVFMKHHLKWFSNFFCNKKYEKYIEFQKTDKFKYLNEYLIQ